MPTRLPERRRAPDDRSPSIYFLLMMLLVLVMAGSFSVASLSVLGLSFGPDSGIEQSDLGSNNSDVWTQAMIAP